MLKETLRIAVCVWPVPASFVAIALLFWLGGGPGR